MVKVFFKSNDTTKKFVLSLFNKSTDKEGFIIEKDTQKRVLNSDGDEIKLEDFGGITNGSEIYLKNNIVSLINFYKNHSGRTI